LWLEGLQADGAIEICALSGETLLTYLELGASGLDDGESATIALAIHSQATAVLDERRARRVFITHYSDRKLCSTVELLQTSYLQGYLSRHDLEFALLNALQIARMQVTPELLDWVIEIIGLEKAKQCSSLAKMLRLKKH
jgi:predicted nucleic acid-binding protein